MGIKGRKEGGEGKDSYLSFFEKFWKKRATRKGFCWRLLF